MKRSVIVGLSTTALVAGLTGAGSLAAHAAPAPSHTAPALSHGASTSSGHGMGLDLDALKNAPKATKVTTFGAMPMRSSLKAGSGDLTRFALTPGDQARTNSCVAWATGYTGYGVLMNEDNIQGAPMAPMFLYTQINDGRDEGSTGGRAMEVLQSKGIDTRAHYSHGDYDWQSQPNESEFANAAHYKMSGYQTLPTYGDSAKQAIESAIDNGYPVAIGMQIHQNFMDMDATTAGNYTYTPSGPVEGGHETTIVGYTSQGVKIENSWSSGWGDGGYYTLPWSFVTWGDLTEAHAMGKIQGGNPDPAPTDNPTDDPTDDPTDPTDDPTDGPWDLTGQKSTAHKA